MYQKGFQKDASIYYNKISADIVLKGGGIKVNEINLKERPFFGKDSFKDCNDEALLIILNIDEKVINTYIPENLRKKN